ncbi:MAG: cache domain-containing protein [Candidatus Shapirobacteria bacterium]|nr:cache domain-containing protein [Candidatus Shapirobacteria bacterium]MDD4382933.1 cache domain-containing protein [Candidatus Shapirobacteria bacterium]
MKNKKSLLFLIFILLITSVVFNAIFFYQQSKQQNIKIKADALDIIDQRLNTTYYEVNNFPSGAADNLLFLSKLSEFQKISTGSAEINNLEKDFLEFLTQSEAYYQISYLVSNKKVLLTAEFDGKERQIISGSNNKQQDSSYFDLLKNLKKGEVYIFPLTLENKIPILKYATPIFDQKTNELKGIILTKVYANYFLDSIRRSQREGEVTYLIDKNGFYLANPDKNKEFGYLSENENNNFFVDYPMISKDLINKCNERRQETDEQFFTYRCINPTISNFEIYEGLKTVNENLKDDYQWLLITVTNKSDGLKDFTQQKKDYLWAIFIQMLIQGFVFILLLMEKKIF